MHQRSQIILNGKEREDKICGPFHDFYFIQTLLICDISKCIFMQIANQSRPYIDTMQKHQVSLELVNGIF